MTYFILTGSAYAINGCYDGSIDITNNMSGTHAAIMKVTLLWDPNTGCGAGFFGDHGTTYYLNKGQSLSEFTGVNGIYLTNGCSANLQTSISWTDPVTKDDFYRNYMTEFSCAEYQPGQLSSITVKTYLQSSNQN